MTDTLYTIPQNWRWCILEEVSECLDNFRKPINATERAARKGTIPYYGATGQIGWIDDFLTDEQLILLGEDGAPFLDTFKDKAYLIEGKAWVNNHAHILRSYFGNFGNRYLKYYLNTFDFAEYVTGTTRLKLTQTKMKNIPIPIPPLAEQKRIVERLDSLFEKLDAAKKILQDIVDGYEQRRAAILQHAFTGELTEDFRKKNNLSLDDWQEKTLGEIVNNHDYKRIPLSNKQRTNIKKIYDYYGASGVIDKVDDYIFDGKYLLIGEDGANLISRSKPIAFIANGKYWVNNHAHILSTKEILVMEFLCFYINYIDLTPYVTGSAQPKLTQKNLNIIPVPLPPLEEQKEISRRLDSLLGKENQAKEIAEKLLSEIETLKKTILSRAFRGELGTNNPSENAVENFI